MSTRGITCRIVNAHAVFKGPTVRVRRALVSRTVSNARYLFEQGQPLDERAELQWIDEGVFSLIDGTLSIGLAQPASSVSLVELNVADPAAEQD